MSCWSWIPYRVAVNPAGRGSPLPVVTFPEMLTWFTGLPGVVPVSTVTDASGKRQIDPARSYLDNGLSGTVEIDWGPSEGGGG